MFFQHHWEHVARLRCLWWCIINIIFGVCDDMTFGLTQLVLMMVGEVQSVWGKLLYLSLTVKLHFQCLHLQFTFRVWFWLFRNKNLSAKKHALLSSFFWNHYHWWAHFPKQPELLCYYLVFNKKEHIIITTHTTGADRKKCTIHSFISIAVWNSFLIRFCCLRNTTTALFVWEAE